MLRSWHPGRFSAVFRLVIYCAASITLVLVLLGLTSPSRAQSAFPATMRRNANLRAGAGPNYDVIVSIPGGQAVSVEGRNNTADWLLIRAANGQEGWVMASLVSFSTPVTITSLPIKDTIATSSSAATSSIIPTTPGPSSKVSTILTDDLSIYAAQITPAVRSAMKAVFTKGTALGNNPKVFTRVGDCLTGGGWFFRQFGDGGANDLGPYGYLQDVIDYFSASPRSGVRNSFVLVSQSEHGGFTSAAVQDSTWSDPHYCKGGETPLNCEYRVSKPSISIIMFGVVDVHTSLTVGGFNANLRRIVDQSLNDGIIPILSTAPETPAYTARAEQFNQVVLTIASEKSLPVINLKQALMGFPDKGLDADGIHLTPALKFTRVAFSSMKDGFTVWNYLALQSLYNVWQGIMVS